MRNPTFGPLRHELIPLCDDLLVLGLGLGLDRLLVSDGGLVGHEHGRGPEHVAEGVVQEIENGSCVEVGVSDDLGGEEGLAGAGAEERAEEAVGHVHLVDDLLHGRAQVGKVGLDGGRRIQVFVKLSKLNV